MRFSSFIKTLFLVMTLLILSSCAATVPSHVSLNHEALNYVDSTDVFIGFGDDESSPSHTFSLSKYTLGGLIPALIDVAINSSQAKGYNNPGNIRDVLEDHKGKQEFTDKMRSKLQEVEWLKVKEVSLANSSSNKMYDVYYSLSKASAVLFITTYYSFSEDFRTLKMASIIKLFPKSDNLKTFAYSWSMSDDELTNDNNCIYKNLIEHEKKINQEVSSKEEAILVWANNNASFLRENLDSGTNELAQMISTDLKK